MSLCLNDISSIQRDFVEPDIELADVKLFIYNEIVTVVLMASLSQLSEACLTR